MIFHHQDSLHVEDLRLWAQSATPTALSTLLSTSLTRVCTYIITCTALAKKVITLFFGGGPNWCQYSFYPPAERWPGWVILGGLVVIAVVVVALAAAAVVLLCCLAMHVDGQLSCAAAHWLARRNSSSCSSSSYSCNTSCSNNTMVCWCQTDGQRSHDTAHFTLTGTVNIFNGCSTTRLVLIVVVVVVLVVVVVWVVFSCTDRQLSRDAVHCTLTDIIKKHITFPVSKACKWHFMSPYYLSTLSALCCYSNLFSTYCASWLFWWHSLDNWKSTCLTLAYLTFMAGRLLHLPSTEAISCWPIVHPWM